MGNRHSNDGRNAGRPAISAGPDSGAAHDNNNAPPDETPDAVGGESGGIGRLVQIETLAKCLQQRTRTEFPAGANATGGIRAETFVRHVFADHPALGRRLFGHFAHGRPSLTVPDFRQQCELHLALIDDAHIAEQLVQMFADGQPDAGQPPGLTGDGVRHLLAVCYALAAAASAPAVDVQLADTLDAVVRSVFCAAGAPVLSASFVCRWLTGNCPQLLGAVHRYTVHRLTTAYRQLTDERIASPDATPAGHTDRPPDALLAASMAWLLAGALPPQTFGPPAVERPTAVDAAVQLASAALAVQRRMPALPDHWRQLYDSRRDGLGANRFLHHVLGYRGPTLVVLCCGTPDDERLYAVASGGEWREATVYQGGPDCCVLQLQPKFALIDRAPKLLYLNTVQRGYPKGLRAGRDPRRPLLAIDADFERIDVHGIQSPLRAIEVWGCGDSRSREVQLDIRKWQLREAERQRTVKLTAADWLDHPDRYLLELGGRTQYNNGAK